jgi:hypothetical protein
MQQQSKPTIFQNDSMAHFSKAILTNKSCIKLTSKGPESQNGFLGSSGRLLQRQKCE